MKQIRIANTREVGRSNTNAAVRSTYRQVFPIERPRGLTFLGPSRPARLF